LPERHWQESAHIAIAVGDLCRALRGSNVTISGLVVRFCAMQPPAVATPGYDEPEFPLQEAAK
jgi:hypothetical protein